MSSDMELKIRLTADGNGFVGTIKTSSDKLDQFGRKGKKAGNDINTGFGKASQGVKSISRQLSAAKSQLLAFLGVTQMGQAIGASITLADSYKSMQGQLKLVTQSSTELASVQSHLHTIAIETRSDISDITKLYSALSPTFKSMGKSVDDSVSLMRTFNQALALTSPTAAESSSAILQFSQAMGSGVLRGEEFNSIMENGRGVAMTLAQGLDVPIGALRAMAEQGKLTADVVVEALARQAKTVEEQYGNIPVTVSGAMKNLRTEMMITIGEMDKTLGVTAQISSGILSLSNNIDALAGAFTVAGTALAIRYTPAVIGAATATKGLGVALAIVAKNPIVLGITAMATAYFLLADSMEEVKAKAAKKDNYAQEIDKIERALKNAEQQANQALESLNAYKKIRDDLAAKGLNTSGLDKSIEQKQVLYNKAAQAVANYSEELRLARFQHEASIDAIEAENEAMYALTETETQYQKQLREQNDWSDLYSADDIAEENRLKQEGLTVTQAMLTPAEQYNQKMQRLNVLLQSGAISQTTFTRAQKAYKKQLEETAGALSKYDDLIIQLGDTSQQVSDAQMAELESLSAQYDQYFSLIESSSNNAARAFENDWIKSIRQGKADFSDFANSVIDDLLRIMYQMTIGQSVQGFAQQLFQGLAGSYSPGAGGAVDGSGPSITMPGQTPGVIDFPATAGRPAPITPTRTAGRPAAGTTVSVTNINDFSSVSSVDEARIAQMLEVNKRQTQAELLAKINRGGQAARISGRR